MEKNLFLHVEVLCHSSIRLSGDRVVYIDPFRVEGSPHNGDLILITHEHFDHFSLEDIEKVQKADSFFVLPASVDPKGLPQDRVLTVHPGDRLRLRDVWIWATPAYNEEKAFHPQEKQWVGYVVELGGLRYYIAGDTDNVEPLRRLSCDVALLPVGGTYTMDAKEAAALAAQIAPQGAVPTHYGSVAGSMADGRHFLELLPPEIEGCEKIKNR